MGSGQGFRRFSQSTARQQTAVTERPPCVQENHIHVPVQPEVLETIVQEQDIRPKAINGRPAGRNPITADHYGDALQPGGHQVGFITGFPGVEENTATVADHSTRF